MDVSVCKPHVVWTRSRWAEFWSYMCSGAGLFVPHPKSWRLVGPAQWLLVRFPVLKDASGIWTAGDGVPVDACRDMASIPNLSIWSLQLTHKPIASVFGPYSDLTPTRNNTSGLAWRFQAGYPMEITRRAKVRVFQQPESQATWNPNAFEAPQGWWDEVPNSTQHLRLVSGAWVLTHDMK